MEEEERTNVRLRDNDGDFGIEDDEMDKILSEPRFGDDFVVEDQQTFVLFTDAVQNERIDQHRRFPTSSAISAISTGSLVRRVLGKCEVLWISDGERSSCSKDCCCETFDLHGGKLNVVSALHMKS